MPESIRRPDFSTVVRDTKVNLERESARNTESAKAKDNLDVTKRNVEMREKTRTAEVDGGVVLQKKVIEKKTEEVQQARRIEDSSNPRSGDIVNVVA